MDNNNTADYIGYVSGRAQAQLASQHLDKVLEKIRHRAEEGFCEADLLHMFWFEPSFQLLESLGNELRRRGFKVKGTHISWELKW